MLATLTALLLAPAYQNAPGVPAAPPVVLDLKPGADGKVTVAVTRTTKEKRKIGNVEREYTTTKQLTVPLAEVKDLTVTTTDGKAVAAADAIKQLADGGVVVASADGNPVDPKFLKLLKPGTLVLSSPEFKAGRTTSFTTGTVIIGNGGVIQAVPLPAPLPAPADKEEAAPAQPVPAKPVRGPLPPVPVKD